jgi:hypothetical protein
LIIEKYIGERDKLFKGDACIYCKKKTVDISELKIKPEKLSEFIFWFINKGIKEK